MERNSSARRKLPLRKKDFALVAIVAGISYGLSWVGLKHVPKPSSHFRYFLPVFTVAMEALIFLGGARLIAEKLQTYGKAVSALGRLLQVGLCVASLGVLFFFGATASTDYYISAEHFEQLQSECMSQENAQTCKEAGALANHLKDPLTSARLYAKACPSDPGSCNSAAWNLAQIPDLESAQKAEALDLSSQAVAAKPETSTYLDTYAATLALNGRFTEAATIQERAIKLLRDQGNPDRISKTGSGYEARLQSYRNREPAAQQSIATTPALPQGTGQPTTPAR